MGCREKGLELVALAVVPLAPGSGAGERRHVLYFPSSEKNQTK